MPDYSKLRCPVCKTSLSQGKELTCPKCRRTYPIVDGIPVMLVDVKNQDKEQDLGVEKQFYEDMFSGLKGFEDGHCIVYGHEKIYEFMDGIERGTVLEAGCGAGHHSVSLSRRGFKITSVDLSLNGLRAAKKLAEHEHQDVSFICGDIKQLPFADNEFDVCFCSLVLHHFLKMDNLVKELARVTRRCFVAFEVNALDPVSFFRFNVINPTIGIKSISTNQRALFPSRLTGLLRQNGFANFEIKYEDMHDHLGKTPDSLQARALRTYQKAMGVLPKKYSQNKFLLRAQK